MGMKLSDIKDQKTRQRIYDEMSKTDVLKPITEIATEDDAKRIRQSSKPLMNKLESDWFEFLKRSLPRDATPTLRAQSVSLRIASGANYRPDISAVVKGKLTFWECKGKQGVPGVAKGLLALKVAATTYPEFKWVLVWRERGKWHQQQVL